MFEFFKGFFYFRESTPGEILQGFPLLSSIYTKLENSVVDKIH